mgnify:CR=1 FL=1
MKAHGMMECKWHGLNLTEKKLILAQKKDKKLELDNMSCVPWFVFWYGHDKILLLQRQQDSKQNPHFQAKLSVGLCGSDLKLCYIS